MISTKPKFHPCLNSIETTVHQPLQIRTNKHRCFIFCVEHTSLTCVPGIGKMNERLLNRSGIYNLSALYAKYRSMKNAQRFKQWLQDEIGFTSYQAKMTTCGISSKLGDVREVNTGLMPICCPRKGHKNKRFKSKKSDDDDEEEINTKIDHSLLQEDNSPIEQKPNLKKILKNQPSHSPRTLSNNIDSNKGAIRVVDSSEKIPDAVKQDSDESDSVFTKNNTTKKKPDSPSVHDGNKVMNEESDNILSINNDIRLNMKSTLGGDNLLDLMKGQKIQNSRFKRIHLSESDWIENATNYGIDSDLSSISHETPPNTKRSGSNSTTKPSYLLSSSSPPLQILPNNQQDTSSQSPAIASSKHESSAKKNVTPNSRQTSSASNSPTLKKQLGNNDTIEYPDVFSSDYSKSPNDTNQTSFTTVTPMSTDENFQKQTNVVAHESLHSKRSIVISRTTTPSKSVSFINDSPTRPAIQQPTLPANLSFETLDMIPTKEGKSLSTLSSLSNEQPLHSPHTVRFDENEASKLSNSDNISTLYESTREINEISSTTSPPFHHEKVIQCDDSTITPRAKTQLHSTERIMGAQSLEENPPMPTHSSNDCSRHETHSGVSHLKRQPTVRLSSPSPCLALWNNISHEKLIRQYKNRHFTLAKQTPSNQKINQNDYNQNYHSYTTLFTYIARRQYFREQQALNEHILYINPAKNFCKKCPND
ncbi:unnamed protein product [Adineta ricciae]|uniref:Uncharacterized protein n=1 Tax=Adineta ricciae TaxID=249248 RepID=A0A813MPG1_ADIRI|nr:unnamed protein product [Adineta ricciae]CAF0774463.1 unnamed protein product [Adineta ricciae]